MDAQATPSVELGQSVQAAGYRLGKVAEVMSTDAGTVPPDMPLRELADRIAKGDPELTRHRGIPIVDGQNRLVGIITQGDLVRVLQANPQGDVPVIEAGSKKLVVAYPDEPVFYALYRMLQNNIGPCRW